MKTWRLSLFVLALPALGLAQAPATGRAPTLRNLNAAQQAAFDTVSAQSGANATAARAALNAAPFAAGASAAGLTRAAQAVADAELALALGRAEAFGRLQASADRLNPTQLSVLAQSAGGRGGGRGGPPATGNAATTAQAGRVAAGDARIRYMGRWDLKPSAATTVNSGTSILFRFRGSTLKGLFQTTTAAPQEASQIYVTIDRGEKQLQTVSAAEIDFAPNGLPAGDHVVEIETKDVSQNSNRWTPPLAAALIFAGFDVGAGEALPVEPALVGRWRSDALRMEFYGDSITQGVRALGMATAPSGTDGTATYSYLTAQAFQASITQVGFGAQGIMRGGGGGVPAASESFYFNYAGSLTDARARAPDVVVVNQGTNDGGASPVVFEPAYLAYLTRIRLAYPKALIAAMRPFNGSQDAAVYAAVQKMKDPQVIYIDTDGWLELTNSPDYTEQPTGLHPSLAGHKKAAERLIAALRAAGVGAPAAR